MSALSPGVMVTNAAGDVLQNDLGRFLSVMWFSTRPPLVRWSWLITFKGVSWNSLVEHVDAGSSFRNYTTVENKQAARVRRLAGEIPQHSKIVWLPWQEASDASQLEVDWSCLSEPSRLAGCRQMHQSGKWNVRESDNRRHNWKAEFGPKGNRARKALRSWSFTLDIFILFYLYLFIIQCHPPLHSSTLHCQCTTHSQILATHRSSSLV